MYGCVGDQQRRTMEDGYGDQDALGQTDAEVARVMPQKRIGVGSTTHSGALPKARGPQHAVFACWGGEHGSGDRAHYITVLKTSDSEETSAESRNLLKVWDDYRRG